MRAHVFPVIFAGALLAAALGGASQAQPYGPPPPRDGRDGVQPLDRLLPGIRRSHPGDIYDAEGPTYGPSGDPHYHLKWMTPDGRMLWFDTDARSGRVLRSSPGRDSFDDHRSDRPPPLPPPPGYARPFVDRPPPSGPDPYERGYGRNFGPGPGYQGPGYTRPDRGWGGRDWGGGRGGRDWGGGRGGRESGGGHGGRGGR